MVVLSSRRLIKARSSVISYAALFHILCAAGFSASACYSGGKVFKGNYIIFRTTTSSIVCVVDFISKV